MPPKICPHEAAHLYKGTYLSCHCTKMKAGKIVAVPKDRLNEVCPMIKYGGKGV